MDGNDLIERLMGGRTPDFAKQHGHLRCDSCLSEIHPPANIGLYAANHDIRRGHVPLHFRVTFCEDCRPDTLPVETKDVIEILLHVEVLDEGGLPWLDNAQVKAKSRAEDGIEWSPGEVWESVSQLSTESMAQHMASKGSALTPAHIWGFLLAMDVDVSNLLDDSGNYAVSRSREDDLREQAQSFILSLSSRR